jgi:hypothetical protein
MPPTSSLEDLLKQTLFALESFGVPLIGLSRRRQEKMAKAVLALAGLKPGMSWSQTQGDDNQRHLRSREIIAFMNAYLAENIADSSYDNIRRQDLALPMEAMVVLKSANNPNANTNDGTRGFAIHPEVAIVLRTMGSSSWGNALVEYLKNRPNLALELQRKRDLSRVQVRIAGGKTLSFSTGKHNALQKNIIENYLPMFGFGAEVLYVGDTEKKALHMNQKRLAALNFFELKHNELPDIVAYSKAKNWVFLIEAVTTANPVTELRRRVLLDLTKDCSADVVLVTAFPDRNTYRKFCADIAWETEVWIADAPEHLIHLNGDKFLGPYRGRIKKK